MKSEPGTYSIDDLARDRRTEWEGVRNFQARNFLRDAVKKDDLVLFYHSNAQPSGVAGVARVTREGFPDASAWKKGGDHFDPRSTEREPLWFAVELGFVSKFKTFVPLDALKAEPRLKGMMVTRRGARLSVQPVEKAHFELVRRMGGER